MDSNAYDQKTAHRKAEELEKATAKPKKPSGIKSSLKSEYDTLCNNCKKQSVSVPTDIQASQEDGIVCGE
jgi:hypothetical protein